MKIWDFFKKNYDRVDKFAKTDIGKDIEGLSEESITKAGDTLGKLLATKKSLVDLDATVLEWTFGLSHPVLHYLIGRANLPFRLDLIGTRAWKTFREENKGKKEEVKSENELSKLKKALDEALEKNLGALHREFNHVMHLNTEPVNDADECEVLCGYAPDGSALTEIHIRRLCSENIRLRQIELHAQLVLTDYGHAKTMDGKLADECAKRLEWIEKVHAPENSFSRTEAESLMREMIDELRKEMLMREQRASSFKDFLDFLRANQDKIPSWYEDVVPFLEKIPERYDELYRGAELAMFQKYDSFKAELADILTESDNKTFCHQVKQSQYEDKTKKPYKRPTFWSTGKFWLSLFWKPRRKKAAAADGG